MSCAKGRRGEVSEREVESYLQEQVAAHGGFCYLCNPRGTRGVPDLVVTWPRDGWGQIHLIEVKTIGGAIDPHQEWMHKELRKRNVHVRVIWTKAEVDRYIEEYGARARPTCVRDRTPGQIAHCECGCMTVQERR